LFFGILQDQKIAASFLSTAPTRDLICLEDAGMSNVVVVYHSGYGHTRVMAHAVAQGVERHLGSTCQLIPVEDVDRHWDCLHRADAIIFGAPTYMGSASAPFKGFMDATAAFYLAQPWRDKLAAGFTNSGCLCGDKLNTLLQMAVFAAQHSMIWVGLDLLPARSSIGVFDGQLNRLGSSLGAMAQSNVEQSPDLAPPPEDRHTAAHLGERVARLAERMSHPPV
jgi:multimeric flavodoxin WrbA